VDGRPFPLRTPGIRVSVHVLKRRQVVPGDLAAVFGFFEDPKNLEAITPPWLRFEVRSSTTERATLGTEITYRLRWLILPMTWESRISEYVAGELFADEMLSGPYKRWYHRHLFTSVPSGVEVTDVVEYQLAFGPLGRLAHSMTVRRQLEAIFDYRHAAITEIFGPPRSEGALSC
jgi:ligand-binding SRPBCC domain-containing protein